MAQPFTKKKEANRHKRLRKKTTKEPRKTSTFPRKG